MKSVLQAYSEERAALRNNRFQLTHFWLAFPFGTPWKLLVFVCLRGYKIGKFAKEGFILNGILNTARAQCSHFIPLESIRKPEVFWCFQGVQNGRILQKTVKEVVARTYGTRIGKNSKTHWKTPVMFFNKVTGGPRGSTFPETITVVFQ